jgi:hypothetical protein
MPTQQPDMIISEIGRRGDMTASEASAAADTLMLSVIRWPKVGLMLMIGGYDDDPRFLGDIPEAMEQFRRFATELYTQMERHNDYRPWGRFDQMSRALMELAIGVRPRASFLLVDNGPEAPRPEWWAKAG